MIWRGQLSRFLIGIFISVGCFHTTEVHCTYIPFKLFSGDSPVVNSIPTAINIPSNEVNELNVSLKRLLLSRDYSGSRTIVGRIIQKIGDDRIDDKTLSESYYLIGIYYSIAKNYYESIKYLNLSVELKERNKEYDETFSKALYNLGFAFNGIGDFSKHEDYSLKSLEMDIKIYGESSPDLIGTYSSLITAYIELQEYEKAINFSNIALAIANNNTDLVSPVILAGLYNNLGVCYSRLANFSKAKIYLDKSESFYKNNHLVLNESYINLMNSMAIAYGALGLTGKSEEYYEQGIAKAVSINSSIAYNIVNSYAIILGNAGEVQKGESLLIDALDRSKIKYGENPRSYFEVLNYYADYLREYKIDNKKSIECYIICMDYLRKNNQDLFLKTAVHIGYSLSLAEAGELSKALGIIQSLLFSDYRENEGTGIYDNPSIETIKPDRKSLNILKAKYEILWKIFKKSQDQKTLEAASGTAELIVSLLEKVRINISEEESRLVLGDRYRDSYLNAIRDFNLLYSKTADHHFLEKAFEYSEKSKVAGLLTSTRELKAVQFHIPSDIADSEKKLQRDISLFNARIAEEIIREEPDTILINKWRENLLETTSIRDSLILVFENQYPGYYAIKYNTQVAKLKDIPEIIGRNVNYINYVISDTILYILVANRKHQQLLAIPVDSSFYGNIRQFRNLLSIPSPSDNAKIAFRKYQSIGYELYKTLIHPVVPYLISDQLIISPDNILSYLPFEAIPTAPDSGERILYRELAYLMNDFDISYTYSATFMAESVRKEYSIGNKVIVFAPNYPEPIDIQSVLMNRQAETSILPDLPYARQEAEYVSDITGGKLFLNDEARESVYKAESGKYDIIHLAMHTILNDKDPMNSTLIFSPEVDTIDDRYLKTYEVYGIPLKAKMVVLSSCNTGTGFLYSGEGILSLARGFIYSGSQSVVMSMWEIEDRSGTEIVKMFYKNLKKGNSKSVALRKARIAYLKKSDQLRSHPYFWSTLVIYGNNTPLYYSKHLIIAAVIFAFIVFVSLILYFRKRKYS
ncbi:MAG: CHAT domain-containing protein [Bacteroidia bacterium]|nr:CHAT domain-containing protein [Bacteroidia bacterium]